MSEISNPKTPEVTGDEQKKPEEKFVPKQAYQEVSNDLHKYKAERNDLKAELEKLRADDAARVEAEQLKNGEHQKIADSYKQKFEESEAQRKSDKDKVVNLSKLHSIEKAVGGFHKSIYAKIAVNLDNIKLDENGLITDESLQAEAARIKQEHPALLKAATKGKLPGEAPGEHDTPKDYNSAVRACKTQEELNALMVKNGRA